MHVRMFHVLQRALTGGQGRAGGQSGSVRVSCEVNTEHCKHLHAMQVKGGLQRSTAVICR
jgi:hypothetical protein